METHPVRSRAAGEAGGARDGPFYRSAAAPPNSGLVLVRLFFLPQAPLRPYRSPVPKRQVKTEKKREPSCTEAR